MKKRTAPSLFSAIFLVILVCSVFSGIFLAVLGNDSSGNSNGDPDNWPMYLHDPAHTGYSPSAGPMTNQTLWSHQTGSTNVKSSPAVVDGIVYVGAEDGRLYALDASSGEEFWTFAADCRLGNQAVNSPAVVEGVVYFCSYNSPGNLYALNASTGEKLWNCTIRGSSTSTSPTVFAGVVYVGSAGNSANNGIVYALNASTGSKLWSYTTGGIVASSPAIFVNTVYVTAEDGNLYALNASNGAKLWNYKTDQALYSSPAVADGVVFLSSVNGKVYSFNASTGSCLWIYQIAKVSSFTPTPYSPAVSCGVVYVGTSVGGALGGGVYALNASNGALLWNCKTDQAIYSPPTVAGDVVYVGSYDGDMYAFDASSGNKLWSYTYATNDIVWITISSPAIVDGVAFMGSRAGSVVAFGPSDQLVPTPTPAPTSTPNPTPTGTPCPTPSPAPTASPSPSPSPITPTPTASPNPTPTPTPKTTPTPTPTTTPSPILPSPNLSFYCKSSTTSSGFNVQIQGALLYNGVGLQDEGIQFSYSVTGGATWQDLAYTKTNNDGNFSVTWMPSASGNYVIKATWQGNNIYSNVSALYNFAVAPFNNQNQNVFSVTSNSTLTSLTFDSTTTELSFGVSGPSGTTGVTQVYIPQSLIPDITKLNVMLDGETINYNSLLDGNVWVITFSYGHSSHTVIMELGTAPTPTLTPSPTTTLTTIPTQTTAPSVVLSVTPGATPTPRPTLSPTPTQQPQSTPSPTPSPSNSQLPQTTFTLSIIILAIVTLTVVASVLIFRNRITNKNFQL